MLASVRPPLFKFQTSRLPDLLITDYFLANFAPFQVSLPKSETPSVDFRPIA